MRVFHLNRRSKYGNRKTVMGPYTFDSAKEARRYVELNALAQIGRIKELKVQPRFLLQESFKHQGETFRKIEYVADFSYCNDVGEAIVEDVKSPITKKHPVYRLKKKLLLAKYGEIMLIET